MIIAVYAVALVTVGTFRIFVRTATSENAEESAIL